MNSHRSFPFRWVLPSTQFLICLVILWPVRNWLLFGVVSSIHAYTPQQSASTRPEEKEVLILPSFNPEQMEAADAAARTTELRMKVPLTLNLPVLLAQLPYVLLNPAKREWVPKGMIPETWRALSWPFAGIIFWWLAGRGIEALRAARRSLAYPKIGKIETATAAILFCAGVVAIIAIADSAPADRSDLQYIALLAGGWLWGILASMTMLARFLQWRIARVRTQESALGHETPAS